MRIEAYFEQVLDLIGACPVVRLSNVANEKRGTYEGLVRGELTFVDGSILHFREYVDAEAEIDRLMYVYQYMAPDEGFIFRYDNTGHHRKLNLQTYPHHKHEGVESNVIASAAPVLAEILDEIERLVTLEQGL